MWRLTSSQGGIGDLTLAMTLNRVRPRPIELLLQISNLLIYYERNFIGYNEERGSVDELELRFKLG